MLILLRLGISQNKINLIKEMCTQRKEIIVIGRQNSIKINGIKNKQIKKGEK